MNQRSDSCQPVLEQCTRPIHPQSAPGSSRRPRPHQPIFPKTMQEPRKYATLDFTIAIRARGPAATRHFATHEHRLPILPMSLSHADSTVALPSLPCRIRPLAALPPKPLFRTSQIVSDRLGSSQIVWDRLRSSGIVRAHSRLPSAIPADLPKCSPDSAGQTGKRARHFSLFRAKIRPPMPVRKEAFARHLEVVDTSKCWPTNVAIYNMPAFSANFGSPDSWRQNRCLSRRSELCQL